MICSHASLLKKVGNTKYDSVFFYVENIYFPTYEFILFFYYFRRYNRSYKMSHAGHNLNLNDVWSKVSEGIEHIYRIQDMSPSAYMVLYT
jgi:hypothetical protein